MHVFYYDRLHGGPLSSNVSFLILCSVCKFVDPFHEILISSMSSCVYLRHGTSDICLKHGTSFIFRGQGTS